MKKIKFSFIDIIIVAVIILALAVGIKILKPSIGVQSNQEVYFAVRASKVDAGMSELVSVGDKVRVSFSEDAYANVVGVSEEPCKEPFYVTKDEHGAKYNHYELKEIEGKSDVSILLSCDARVTDTEIINNNALIRVGENAVVHGKGYTFSGYIVEIEEEASAK